MTNIFATKKLEKIIQKKIEGNDLIVENSLGDWNAHVFYVAKKKCILFVNAKTLFSVIIPQFSTKNIDRIDELFIDTFYNQLLFEKIDVNYENIRSKIGQLKFRSTNNNRKAIGVLNYNIETMNILKKRFSIFNSSVIREMTERLNAAPFNQLDWKSPHKEMVSLLSINEL